MSRLIRGRIQASGLEIMIGYQDRLAGLCVIRDSKFHSHCFMVVPSWMMSNS